MTLQELQLRHKDNRQLQNIKRELRGLGLDLTSSVIPYPHITVRNPQRALLKYEEVAKALEGTPFTITVRQTTVGPIFEVLPTWALLTPVQFKAFLQFTNPMKKNVYSIEEILASKPDQKEAYVTLGNVVGGRAYHGKHGWVNMRKELTGTQQTALHAFFAKGCKMPTQNRLKAVLANPAALKSDPLFARVMIYRDKVEYVAGQHYVEEIQYIRKKLKF